MAKNYFLKMLAGIALMGILASCNTTADPTESGSNPDPGVPPPKILEKISVNAVAQEEYISTEGILEQAVFKDEASTANGASYTATLSYTLGADNKKKDVKTISFVSSSSASFKYVFDITPDSKGKIYNATGIATNPNPGLSYISDYAFTYDPANGKLTKILEKRKEGGISAYNKFIEYAFTYNGENIFQTICSKGILDINGNPNMGTAVQSKYNFQNYDNNKSPFSTLPKTFSIIRSLIDPVNFYRASPNNPTSMYIEIPSKPTVNTAQSYSYDNQGYPTVEKNQKVAYTYKNF